MEDVIATLIVIGAIFFLVKWLLGSRDNTTSEGGIRGVTPAMVETIHSAFPDVPVQNIVYHLSRTRSAQATSEELLEKGFLPPPPPTFNIPANLIPNSPSAEGQVPSNTAPNVAVAQVKHQSLIDRYNLSSRLHAQKGKEKADETLALKVGADGKGNWEDSKEKREMGLKERKEKMVLEARRRLLEKEARERGTVA